MCMLGHPDLTKSDNRMKTSAVSPQNQENSFIFHFIYMTIKHFLHDNHNCGLAVLVFCLILRLLIILYIYVMLFFLMVIFITENMELQV